jgi:hypothetical protein
MAVLRCIESFAFSDHKNGAERVVRAGDLVDEKDALVKGREIMFESVDTTVERVSDRNAGKTSGAPGEKRTPRRTKAADEPAQEPDEG